MMMTDPLEAIGQSAINAGTNALGGIINMAITKTVDLLFGDTPANRKKLMDEYYSRVQTIVGNHDYAPQGVGGRVITPQQRAMQEIDEVDQSIVEAVQKLEKAHSKSRCVVCKSSLEETINLVKKQTAPIFDATDKIRAMQQLKSAGKLPQDALWESLSPEEKKQVEKVAEKVTKPRDFTPAPEVTNAVVPIGTQLLIQGEMNGDEEAQPRRRSYPIRKTKPTRKPAKRARSGTRKRN